MIDLYVNTLYTKFKGPHNEINQLKQILTIPVPNYFFSKLYKQGLWDGLQRFYRYSTFPTGLLQFISQRLKSEYSVHQRKVPDYSSKITRDILQTKSLSGEWAFQYEAARQILQKKRGIIKIATGGGKTVLMAAVIQAGNLPTLFLVESRDLMKQTYEVFKQELTVPVGMLGDGEEDIQQVTIGITKTVKNRTDDEEHVYSDWIKGIRLVIADECHGVSNNTYTKCIQRCSGAYLRFGMSGTPMEKGVFNSLKIMQFLGPLFIEVSNKKLIEIGVNAKPQIYFHTCDKGPICNKENYMFYEENTDGETVKKLDSKAYYRGCYEKHVSTNEYRNNLIVDITKEELNENKSVLILVVQTDHGNILKDLLLENKIETAFCYGVTDSDERYEELENLRNGKSKVLIMSKIGQQGIDIPQLDTIIRADGGKSPIANLQILGRGTRKKVGKENVFNFHDFWDTTDKFLLEHSEVRRRAYEKEGFQIVTDSGTEISTSLH